MKAFIDRNYFLHKHDQKYKSRDVGIAVVVEQIGIEFERYRLSGQLTGLLKRGNIQEAKSR